MPSSISLGYITLRFGYDILATMPSFTDWLRRRFAKARPKTKVILSPGNPPEVKPMPCMPTPRPRALTLPLPIIDESKSVGYIKQQSLPQDQSIFFRLPPEIRLRVYEELFGFRKLHLAYESYGDKQGSPSLEWRWWHCVCQPTFFHLYWNDRCRRYEETIRQDHGKRRCFRLDIDLLRVCRRV